MSFAMGLAGAMSGFAQGKMMKDERKARAEDGALFDRYISAIEGQNSKSAASMSTDPASASGGLGTAVGGQQPGQSNTLFGLTAKTEGGGNYDTLFGHAQNGGKFDGVKVSDMTLGQLYDFSSPSGEYGQWVKSNVGHVATPMGAHQIVGKTLRSAAAEMGLPLDTKFTPEVQDSIANHLASRRLAGAKTPAAKRAALRAEWEGFRSVSDDALDQAIATFEASGGAITPRPLGLAQQ